MYKVKITVKIQRLDKKFIFQQNIGDVIKGFQRIHIKC